jgi:hypothetical protein
MMKEIAHRTTGLLGLRQPDRRLAESLNHLSQAEADSAWQMVQAFNASDDPSMKARLFKGALQELDHAALLSKLARKYSSFPLPLAAQRRRHAQHMNGEAAGSEACAFARKMRERDSITGFDSALPRGEAHGRSLITACGEDEPQAMAYGEIDKIVRIKSEPSDGDHRSRLKQVYDAWVELGHAMGDFMFAFWLSVIYYVSGPVSGWLCRRRMEKLDRWQRHED